MSSTYTCHEWNCEEPSAGENFQNGYWCMKHLATRKNAAKAADKAHKEERAAAAERYKTRPSAVLNAEVDEKKKRKKHSGSKTPPPRSTESVSASNTPTRQARHEDPLLVNIPAPQSPMDFPVVAGGGSSTPPPALTGSEAAVVEGTEHHVKCNPAMVGRVFGSGKVWWITSQTSTKIYYNDATETFVVTGATPQDVQVAGKAFANLLNSLQPSGGLLKFTPKQSSARFVRTFLIGYCSAVIRGIMYRADDRCVIDPFQDTSGQWQFAVRADSRDAMTQAISELNQLEHDLESKFFAFVSCAPDIAPMVIGSEGGRNIQWIRLQVGHGTAIQYDNHEHHFVVVAEDVAAVARAERMLTDQIGEVQHQHSGYDGNFNDSLWSATSFDRSTGSLPRPEPKKRTASESFKRMLTRFCENVGERVIHGAFLHTEMMKCDEANFHGWTTRNPRTSTIDAAIEEGVLRKDAHMYAISLSALGLQESDCPESRSSSPNDLRETSEAETAETTASGDEGLAASPTTRAPKRPLENVFRCDPESAFSLWQNGATAREIQAAARKKHEQCLFDPQPSFPKGEFYLRASSPGALQTALNHLARLEKKLPRKVYSWPIELKLALCGPNYENTRELAMQAADYNVQKLPSITYSNEREELVVVAQTEPILDRAKKLIESCRSALNPYQYKLTIAPVIRALIGSSGSNLARIERKVGDGCKIIYSPKEGCFIIISNSESASASAKQQLKESHTKYTCPDPAVRAQLLRTFIPDIRDVVGRGCQINVEDATFYIIAEEAEAVRQATALVRKRSETLEISKFEGQIIGWDHANAIASKNDCRILFHDHSYFIVANSKEAMAATQTGLQGMNHHRVYPEFAFPTALVGALIGAGSSNLQRIMNQVKRGCHIQYNNNTQQFAIVAESSEAVEDALALLSIHLTYKPDPSSPMPLLIQELSNIRTLAGEDCIINYSKENLTELYIVAPAREVLERAETLLRTTEGFLQQNPAPYLEEFTCPSWAVFDQIYFGERRNNIRYIVSQVGEVCLITGTNLGTFLVGAGAKPLVERAITELDLMVKRIENHQPAIDADKKQPQLLQPKVLEPRTSTIPSPNINQNDGDFPLYHADESDYVVDDDITCGGGAQGNILRGRDRRQKRLLAVKLVSRKGKIGEKLEQLAPEACLMKLNDLKAQLAQEAKILDALPDHPNIVKVLATYQSAVSGTPMMFMEYFPRGSLHKVMTPANLGGKREYLPEPTIQHYLENALQGLKHLHERRVWHRDIKPGNMLIADSGELKLADFGLSTQRKEDLCTENYIIGTTQYMAPEIIRSQTYCGATDIWALACCVVEMATAADPWNEVDANGNDHKMSDEKVREELRGGFSHPLLPDDVSDGLIDLLGRMFQLNHLDRPSAVDCLADPYFETLVPLEDINEAPRKSTW